jgi:hypothetical protein
MTNQISERHLILGEVLNVTFCQVWQNLYQGGQPSFLHHLYLIAA